MGAHYKNQQEQKKNLWRVIKKWLVRFLAGIQICACIFGFAWLLVGAVWVFPLEKKHKNGTMKCPSEMWYVAFCWLIIQFCLMCCACTGGGIAAASSAFKSATKKAADVEVQRRMIDLRIDSDSSDSDSSDSESDKEEEEEEEKEQKQEKQEKQEKKQKKQKQEKKDADSSGAADYGEPETGGQQDGKAKKAKAAVQKKSTKSKD